LEGFAQKVRVILFLSHTRLQPGDKHHEGKVNRFNGLLLFSTAKVEHTQQLRYHGAKKPLKRFHSSVNAPVTRLKPGVNEN
jgi:hypothetical protein